MADYSRAYERDCKCGSSVFSNHAEWCTDFKFYSQAKYAKEKEFVPIYTRSDMGMIQGISYYQCNRGCGTIVWDIGAHVNNVCRDYERNSTN